MQVNRTLTSLNVDGNRITAAGAAVLGEALMVAFQCGVRMNA